MTIRQVLLVIFLVSFILLIKQEAYAGGYYTTKGKSIIDNRTGEAVILRGFGIGCWLLPEGYMWGIRKLDRPRHFEEAVVDLIGNKYAEEFWKLYHDNFFTEGDVKAMQMWGVNSIRIALLASKLQPRVNQPANPPYIYSETGFSYLDSVVKWCNKYDIGVIWDMHGAPGGQNAENISDSDGEAGLWTEKEKYWPRLIDLWYKIAERYKDENCIIGYDLLNEPLLGRYEGIDVRLLRELYVKLTQKIRTVDNDGIIFIEGDDWAQNFEILEPIDWDPQLVLAFHSYPPTSSQSGLRRWDKLRDKYNVPLWHGETGEQRPPYRINRKSTEFLEQSDVGWSWWTHKKFDNTTQPWNCFKTPGFQRIIDYWRGEGEKPSAVDAKEWLFEQAVKTHTDYCEFLPDMVESLYPLNAGTYLQDVKVVPPEIIRQPLDEEIEFGSPAKFDVRAKGNHLKYQWYKNGEHIPGEVNSFLRIDKPEINENANNYSVLVSNSMGTTESRQASIHVTPFSGPLIRKLKGDLNIDGIKDSAWISITKHKLNNNVAGQKTDEDDLAGYFLTLWDSRNIYFFIEVTDDIISTASDIDYARDGIEIYFDADNSKSDHYGENDFQFRYVINEDNIYPVIGEYKNEIKCAKQTTGSGYKMEVAISWDSLGIIPKESEFVGLDIHINDNDSNRRENKIAWYASRDNSYQSPRFFGTLKLSE